MKKILVWGMILSLLAGGLFAGGQQAQTQATGLRVMWWGSQNRHERTISTLDLYARQNPNLNITHEFAGWADYWTKLTTMATGRNLPDILQQDYAFLTEWEGRGLLKPMDEFVRSGVLDFRNVAASSLDSGRVNGQLYGINLGVNSESIIIDVDMFNRAGIPVPSDNWTWADFERIAMELHSKLGVYGFGSGLLNEQIWKGLIISSGGLIFRADGSGLGHANDNLLVNHINMVMRLQAAGAIPHISREVSDFASGENVEMQPIVSSQAAMAYLWSNQLTALWTAAGGAGARNFAMVRVPRISNGINPNYIKPSMFFSISRDSSNPQEAARFINFVTNDIEANKILMAERGVPVSSVVRDALAPLVDKPQQVVFEYMGRIGATAAPTPAPDPAGYTDVINNVYKPYIRDGVRFGQFTAEEAVRRFRAESEAILREASRR